MTALAAPTWAPGQTATGQLRQAPHVGGRTGPTDGQAAVRREAAPSGPADAGPPPLPVREGLRALLRRHAAGVCVITTDTGRPSGFCATSLVSVCLDPPTVAFSVGCASSSGQAWQVASYGLVHLLRADQQQLAAAFSRPGPDKLARGWRAGPAGQPLLDGVTAWLLVAARRRLRVGDHLLVVAEVVATGDIQASTSNPATTHNGERAGQMDANPVEPGPLLYHDGGFCALPA